MAGMLRVAAIMVAAGVGVSLLVMLASSIRMVPIGWSPNGIPAGKDVVVPLAVGFVLLLLVILVGVGVRFLAVSAPRETEAEWLEAAISEALNREVGPLSLTLIARAPSSEKTPLIIEITGHVPTPQLRDVVLDIVERQVSRVQPNYRIVDRVQITGAAPAA